MNTHSKSILFVSSSSPYRDLGSAFKYNLSLLKEGLEKSRMRTDVLYLDDYFFKTPQLLGSVNIPWLLKIIKDYNILVGWGTFASYVLGLAKAFVNSKQVFCVRGVRVEEAYLQREKIFSLTGNYQIFQTILMESVALKFSDYFITCSEPLRQHFIHKGIDEYRIKTIRNGVNTDLFRPKKMESKNEHFTVTYAGAFQKWQGIKNLILAAKLLEKTNIEFKFIGFTKRDFRLKKRIAKILKNKVILIEQLTRTELVDDLNDSDICVIPRSRNLPTEVAFPTKFAEYIAVGKPVIVTRVGEIPKFVKKYDCGFVCEPSPESIAHTIKKAMEMSPEMLFSKGMNGRRLAESKFDQRVISGKYFNFLSRILKD